MRTKVGSIVLGLVVVGVVLACSFNRHKNNVSAAEPTVLTWDFSQRQKLVDTGWTAGSANSKNPSVLTDPYIQRDGNFDFTLKLSEERLFHERIARLYVKRKDDDIEVLGAATPYLTLDEAHAKAEELIRYWKFDKRDLDEWYARHGAAPNGIATAGDSHGDEYKFETHQNSTYPGLSLSIPYSFNDQKPWYILFEANWLKTTGPR